MALISPIYHVKQFPKPPKNEHRVKLDNLNAMDRPAVGLPANSAAERKFIRRARGRGWEVLRAGWPDFMLVRKTAKGIEFQAVEVKKDHESDQLRASQRLMVASLVMQGIPVSVWSAEKQTLRRITPEEAKATISDFLLQIEQKKVRDGLHELRNLGALVRYDI